MPLSYTALHQSAPKHTAHPKCARWTRDRDEQDRRWPASRRTHSVGPDPHQPWYPMVVRDRRQTGDGSTFSVDVWFMSLFRHTSGCCGSKMIADTWPCPGTVTSVVRVANVLATGDVARTLGAIGASGPGCGCQQ